MIPDVGAFKEAVQVYSGIEIMINHLFDGGDITMPVVLPADKVVDLSGELFLPIYLYFRVGIFKLLAEYQAGESLLLLPFRSCAPRFFFLFILTFFRRVLLEENRRPLRYWSGRLPRGPLT